MQRFVEHIDFLFVLHKAGIVEFDDSNGSSPNSNSLLSVGGTNPLPPRNQSTPELQTTEEAMERRNLALTTANTKPIRGGEEKLNDIFANQGFQPFYQNVHIDDGVQVHYLDNHVIYLAVYMFGYAGQALFILVRLIPEHPLTVTATVFGLVTCPLAALLLAHGSPLQLSSQKHRANLHEAHATVLLAFRMALLAVPFSECDLPGSSLSSIKECLQYLTSAGIGNIMVMLLMVPRGIFVLPIIGLYMVAVNILVWTGREALGVPLGFYASQMLVMHVAVVTQLGALLYRSIS